MVNVVEDRKAIMVRFLNRLNREITNVVELHHYIKVEDMVHMAMKIKRQLRRKGHVRPTFNLGSSTSWKLNLRREGATQPKKFIPTKVESPKAKVETSTIFKGKSEAQPKCTRDVKYFRC